MADSTISQLPSALTISPVDFFAIDQGGVTKKATLALLGSNVVFVAAGKVFTVNNTLTLAGTDGTTMTFPSTNASLARTDAAQSFAGLQTFTNGITTPAQLASTVATGTPPLVVASTTPVANLSIGGNAATVTTNANLTGEVTSVGNAATIGNAAVIAKVLTGFVSGAGVVAATDTILQAVDKLDGNVAARALLAGSASQTFSVAPATTGTMAPEANQMHGRNLFVNGSSQVDQVNSGAIISPLIDGSYVVDNFIYNQSQVGKLSGQQIAGSMITLGAYTAQRYIVLSQFASAAGDFFVLNPKVEGLSSANLNWGTASASPVSLQFKINVSVAGTYSGCIKNEAGTRSYPFSFSVPVANTDTQIKIENIPGDTSGAWVATNAASIRVAFDLGSGTTFLGTANAWAAANYVGVTGSTAFVNQVNGSRLDITDFQLEKGSFCTTFERKLYDQVFRESQRYARPVPNTAIGQALSAATSSHPIYGSVVMRATPTLSTTSGYTTSTATGTNNAATPAIAVVFDNLVYVTTSGGSGMVAGNATLLGVPAGAMFLARL